MKGEDLKQISVWLSCEAYVSRPGISWLSDLPLEKMSSKVILYTIGKLNSLVYTRTSFRTSVMGGVVSEIASDLDTRILGFVVHNLNSKG